LGAIASRKKKRDHYGKSKQNKLVHSFYDNMCQSRRLAAAAPYTRRRRRFVAPEMLSLALLRLYNMMMSVDYQ
jgi:hypothetical protein